MVKINLNLLEYDWIVINTSGGKDSQAMTDFICRQARELGILDRVILAHADLGRVEWKGAKELCETHAKLYQVSFRWMKRPQGDLLDHINQRGMFPSSDARYCTSDHKRGQVDKIIRSLPGSKILNCLGFRKDESPARAKRIAFTTNKRLTTRTRTVHDWLPIHEWTVDQVWTTIRASGVPYHFAYDLGMPRLSCCFCIFAPKNALLLAGKHNPELLNEYVATEKRTGHTFRHKFSIETIKQELDAGVEPGPIQNWTM